MTDRQQYAPGPASGGAGPKGPGTKTVKKSGRSFSSENCATRPRKVWQAITDPVHLREWAPFDADGSLGTVGATVKLTTVAAPAPRVTETTVTRADAPNVLEYKWGGFDMRWELEAFGGRHAPDAVDQHRSPLHRNGRCRVAHLFRCTGSASGRSTHRPNRRPPRRSSSAGSD